MKFGESQGSAGATELLDLCEDPLLVVDPDGRITFANSAAEMLFEQGSAELLDARVAELERSGAPRWMG